MAAAARRDQGQVRHAHQHEPARPRDRADQAGGHDGRDAAGQQYRGRQAVHRVQHQHDGAGERRAGRHAAEREGLVVDVDEDAGARGGRREQQREHGQREQQVRVERAGPAPPAREQQMRHPLGEAAPRHRHAQGQHADQEVGDGIREAHEPLADARHRVGEDERHDRHHAGDAGGERLEAPEPDGEHDHGEDALALQAQAFRRGRRQHRQASEERNQPAEGEQWAAHPSRILPTSGRGRSSAARASG